MPPFERRTVGQGVVNYKDEVNAWNDAALAHRRGKVVAQEPRDTELPLTPCEVTVLNNTGSDQGPFAVYGLGSPVLDVSTRSDITLEDILLSGITPAVPQHNSRFAIVPQGLKSGEIGRGIVPSATWVKVDVTDAAHGYATVKDNDATQLASSDSGFPIIKGETGIGPKWCIVLLNAQAIAQTTACFGTFAVGSCSETPTLATLEMMDGSAAPAVGAVTVNNRCGLASRNGDAFVGHVRWNEDPVVVEISEVTNRTVTLDRVIYDAPDLKVQTVTMTGQFCVDPIETPLVTLSGNTEGFCYGTFTQGSCNGLPTIASMTMIDGGAPPTLAGLVVNNRSGILARDGDAFLGHVNWYADPPELEIVQVTHHSYNVDTVTYDNATHTIKRSVATILAPGCYDAVTENVLAFQQRTLGTSISFSAPTLSLARDNVWVVDPSSGTPSEYTAGPCQT